MVRGLNFVLPPRGGEQLQLSLFEQDILNYLSVSVRTRRQNGDRRLILLVITGVNRAL